MRCSLTRAFAFHARHRYHRPAWSDAENAARFGATAVTHGHLYQVEATVGGSPDPDTGMLIDLGVLDRILTDAIVTPLAGRDLETAVPAFAPGAALPTCEAIAGWCFAEVTGRLPDGVSLLRIRVAEDATLWAEWSALP